MENKENTITAWENQALLRSTVRALNAQHMSYGAGFYGSVIGGRFFKARSNAGKLEVFDFENWHNVPQDKAIFHDHNGHTITLSR